MLHWWVCCPKFSTQLVGPEVTGRGCSQGRWGLLSVARWPSNPKRIKASWETAFGS